MAEEQGAEAQGAVIELDPLHLQIPLAHDLPEDIAQDSNLLFHPAVLIVLEGQDMKGVGANQYLYQGHVLAH